LIDGDAQAATIGSPGRWSAGSEDRAAFREAHQPTSAKLYGICLRLCGETQVVENVLHEGLAHRLAHTSPGLDGLVYPEAIGGPIYPLSHRWLSNFALAE
jgi:hypothetical protein